MQQPHEIRAAIGLCAVRTENLRSHDPSIAARIAQRLGGGGSSLETRFQLFLQIAQFKSNPFACGWFAPISTSRWFLHFHGFCPFYCDISVTRERSRRLA